MFKEKGNIPEEKYPTSDTEETPSEEEDSFFIKERKKTIEEAEREAEREVEETNKRILEAKNQIIAFYKESGIPLPSRLEEEKDAEGNLSDIHHIFNIRHEYWENLRKMRKDVSIPPEDIMKFDAYYLVIKQLIDGFRNELHDIYNRRNTKISKAIREGGEKQFNKAKELLGLVKK